MFWPSLMNQNEFSLEVANEEYHFLHVCIVCSDCKSTIFFMWGRFVMNQNTFSFEVMNTLILQDYCFLPDGTLCDASKRILCSDCKNTVFFMLGHFVMHQNQFLFEVLYTMIARILFSTWWNIVWCIKMNFLLKYCMQWLQEYWFILVIASCDYEYSSFHIQHCLL